MSNLPHPLGDSSSGDLFYPGSPDVIALDAPGAKGSRAVEFGEDGASSAVNRGLYALGKNDEYQQERLEQSFARPELATWTPSGGSGTGYTFTGVSVFVGTSDYTPETQQVRSSLIAVLDENYNDLLNPSTGKKISVKAILDAPAGSSVVGGGFQTAPYITFREVDPVDETPGSDYTIPDGTTVILSFGQAAKLDDLIGTSSEKLQDAWFRGHNRSIGEVHAATFLHDGSRKATGSFDMDYNDLLNVDEIQGGSGDALVLTAFGGTNADLVMSATGLLTLKDRWLSAAVDLSHSGMTGLFSSVNPSIVGMLNSGWAHDFAMLGNPIEPIAAHLTSWSAFTFNGTTGEISWPAFSYSYNGDLKTIAASSTTPTADVDRLLVVRGGAVTVIDPGVLGGQDLPLYAFHFDSSESPNGYTNVNGYNRDVRWLNTGRINALEITVGVAGSGADFSSLQKAVDFACHIGQWAGPAAIPGGSKIKIKGYHQLNDPLEIRSPVTIEGEDPLTRITTTNDNTEHGIHCNGHRVVFRNLSFAPGFNTGNGTKALFRDPGDHSIFQNLLIDESGSSYRYQHVFDWVTDANYRYHMSIDNIHTAGVTAKVGGFINGGIYMSSSYITNCHIVCDSAFSVACCDTEGGGCKYANNSFLLVNDPGIKLGTKSLFMNNQVHGASTGDGLIQIARPSGHGSGEHAVKIIGNYFWRGDYGIRCNGLVPDSVSLDLTIEGNTFHDITECINVDVTAAKLVHACVKVIGNTGIDGTYFVYASEVDNVTVKGNFTNDISYPLSMNSVPRVIATENFFYDCNSTGYLIGWNSMGVSSSETFIFKGNYLRPNASGAATAMYLSGWNAVVEGNVFDISITPGTVISSTAARGHRIMNNVFPQTSDNTVEYLNSFGSSVYLERGLVIGGNHFLGAAEQYCGCLVSGFTASVVNNVFCPDASTSPYYAGGSCVEIETRVVSGDKVPHGSIVSGNYFSYHKGLGTRYATGSIPVYVGPGSGTTALRDCIVSGNSWNKCGTDTTSLVVTYQLVMAAGGSVNGNTFAWCEFAQNAGASGYFIWTSGGYHSIVGNSIFMDCGTGKPCTGTMVGIKCNITSQAVGNYLGFQGSGAAITTLFPIDGNDSCTIVGNSVGGVTSLAYDAIHAGYNYIIVVGNYAERGVIDMTGCDVTSICIGNLAHTDGTSTGAAKTTGNT
jgi:hypothetical protein